MKNTIELIWNPSPIKANCFVLHSLFQASAYAQMEIPFTIEMHEYIPIKNVVNVYNGRAS